MRLASVKIENYRSAAKAELDNCGNLNVLIGKNNSGKSNIVSAIQRFFEFFASGNDIATALPSVRAKTDWHNNSSGEPARISITLLLTESEISDLKEAISQETPQVKNALSNLVGGALVEFVLTFIRKPSVVGFLSKIQIIDPSSTHGNSASTIFGLSSEAAIEIAQRQQDVERVTKQISALDAISHEVDDDDFRSIRDRGTTVSPGLMRRIASLPGESSEQVRRVLHNVTSAEDVRQRVAAFRADLMDKVALVQATENTNPIITFSGESSIVPAYVTQLAAKIGNLRVHSLSEQRKPIGDEEARRILGLKMSRGQSRVLADIQKSVQDLLGVRIDAFTNDQQRLTRVAGASALSAELDVDDFLVQVNGSGIKEALRLMLDYEFERPDIMLVEEPEVHLHPALEITMMQYLKRISSNCQIFLTTHSTNFLDTAELRNIYLVTKNGHQSTQVDLLDAGEAEEAIPQELGIRLSSLFMYDRLVFVEGPTDEQILRTFASTLGINLGQSAVGFVTTGGARNFTHYANASTLNFLSKRRVKLIFILDRDERIDSEVEQLRSKLGDLGSLIVLKRREIENYLLAPEALARFINKNQMVPSPRETTSEQVAEALEAACESLMPVAIERRLLKLACRPFIPDRNFVIRRGDVDLLDALIPELDRTAAAISEIRANAKQTLEEMTSEVQRSWSERKFDIVPGDELLRCALSRLDIPFNKRKDGVRVAAEMDADEIPEEIRKILGNLIQ